jgi:hypothetical protein
MYVGDKLGSDHRCKSPFTALNSIDRIRQSLGEGTFGKVVECVDRDSKSYELVAVKVIKSTQ